MPRFSLPDAAWSPVVLGAGAAGSLRSVGTRSLASYYGRIPFPGIPSCLVSLDGKEILKSRGDIECFLNQSDYCGEIPT